MAKMDMANNIGPVNHIAPAVYDATETPATGVDIQGYESCTFIISTGTITDGTFTITFEESDEAAANFVEIDPTADGYLGQLVGDIPGPLTNVGMAFDNQIYKVGYVGSKRYARCVVTVTGMPMTGGELQVSAVLGDPHDAPVSVGFA